MHNDREHTSPTPPSFESAPRRPQTHTSFRADVLKFALIFFLILVPFRIFIAQPFIVSGASMDPTFHSGDYLIVDQITPKIGDGWKRLDVVVFKFPYQKSRFLIKRIIGLPGDTVNIENGIVTITNKDAPDGFTLEEPYITHTLRDSHRVTLGEHEYFVMGDNRAGSYDSRAWGPLDEDLLVGEPLVRLYPFSVIDLKPGEVQ